MNDIKIYALVIFICIMLISLILAFADYIDGNVPIVQDKAQQERQASRFIARQNDYYAKAIVLLNDSNNNLLHGVK